MLTHTEIDSLTEDKDIEPENLLAKLVTNSREAATLSEYVELQRIDNKRQQDEEKTSKMSASQKMLMGERKTKRNKGDRKS